MSDGGASTRAREGAGVLIVDDEMLVAAYLEDVLIDLDIEINGIAGSVDQALALARERRPAVAMVDIGLRGTTDGVGLARELQDGFGVTVVFLTGSSDAGTRRAADAIRPYGFLTKPCSEDQIADMLRAALRAAGSAPPDSSGRTC